MKTEDDRLDTLLTLAAEAAERDSVAIDGEPFGAVHRWARENITYRADQEFFVVFLLTAKLADREAQREGFAGQSDRAARSIKARATPAGSPRSGSPGDNRHETCRIGFAPGGYPRSRSLCHAVR